MNPLADALEELIALGVEGPALVAAMRRLECATYTDRMKTLEEAVAETARLADEQLQKANARRAKDAERKRVQRTSADVLGNPGTSADVQGSRPHVVNTLSSSLRSEEVGGGGVGERERDPSPDDWPEGGARQHAEILVQTVASAWLDPCKSPDLVTTSGRLAAWKRDGASWEHDVLPVVTGLCANRRARVSSWKFFDQAIARSISDNRAALEIPEASRVVPFRGQGPPNDFAAQQAAVRAEARRRVLEDGQ